MKIFLHYQDNEDRELHKTLKITLPKSWKTGPSGRLLGQFVESYNGKEKLGSANSLDEEQMHLAIREGGEDGGDENSTMKPVASDAVIIDAVPDRGDVYIIHGPSKTVEELAREAREKAEKEKAERSSMVACKHFGCQKRFSPGGPYPECCYHKSPPVFHETVKFWSCCPKKKAYDWEQFQAIPGCMVGQCTEVKEEQKEFLGGCDLREQASGTTQLKSIDDFNRTQEGGPDAVDIINRLKNILAEIGVENELFDQVVGEIEKEVGEHTAPNVVAAEMGKKLKEALKSVAAEQLRIK